MEAAFSVLQSRKRRELMTCSSCAQWFQ